VTEASQVNDAIRRHLGPLGLFRRVEVATSLGWPDWYYRLHGVAGWLEAKIFTASLRPRKLTLEQVMWGEEEVRARGRWTLFGIEPRSRTWLAFDAPGARSLCDGAEATPTLRAVGPFPLKELARLLCR